MVGELLSSFLTGAELGGGILSLWYGSHSEDLIHALNLLKEYDETGCENTHLVSAAINCLYQIPDDEKKYILVTKDLLLSIAYCYSDKYVSAYRCIDRIEAVEVTWLTAKSDTIKEIQSSTSEYRKEIHTMEQEYLRRLEEQRKQAKKDDKGESKFTKWLIVIGVVIIVELILLFIFS